MGPSPFNSRTKGLLSNSRGVVLRSTLIPADTTLSGCIFRLRLEMKNAIAAAMITTPTPAPTPIPAAAPELISEDEDEDEDIAVVLGVDVEVAKVEYVADPVVGRY